MPPARILPKDVAAPAFRRQEFPLGRVGRILKTRRRRLARSAVGLGRVTVAGVYACEQQRHVLPATATVDDWILRDREPIRIWAAGEESIQRHGYLLWSGKALSRFVLGEAFHAVEILDRCGDLLVVLNGFRIRRRSIAYCDAVGISCVAEV